MLHLARRFFGYLRSTPPTPGELDTVRTQLSAELYPLFVAMNAQDQRHAMEVAQRAGDPAIVEAALLHDVGKSAAPIGAFARSLATVASALRIPVTGSWRLYREHGEIGAAMLESAGANPLTVAFARFHPGPPPTGISTDRWHALEDADDI